MRQTQSARLPFSGALRCRSYISWPERFRCEKPQGHSGQHHHLSDARCIVLWDAKDITISSTDAPASRDVPRRGLP